MEKYGITKINGTKVWMLLLNLQNGLQGNIINICMLIETT